MAHIYIVEDDVNIREIEAFSLKNSGYTVEEIKQMKVGEIELNDEKRQVKVSGEPITLTYKEYELLKMLMSNTGIVLQREDIMVRIWGMDYEGESRTLDMHIKTLRHKLGDAGKKIRTVRNVGYQLEE